MSSRPGWHSRNENSLSVQAAAGQDGRLGFPLAGLHPVAIELDFEDPAGIGRDRISQRGQLGLDETWMLERYGAGHVLPVVAKGCGPVVYAGCALPWQLNRCSPNGSCRLPDTGTLRTGGRWTCHGAEFAYE